MRLFRTSDQIYLEFFFFISFSFVFSRTDLKMHGCELERGTSAQQIMISKENENDF